MRERTLLKLAITGSILGIIILYIISTTFDIEESSVPQLKFKELDEMVKIKGIVTAVDQRNDVSYIDITESVTQRVTIFENISIPKNAEVEIIGSIDQYNDKTQILAERIRII